MPGALQESSRSSVTGTVKASWTEETAIISLLLGPVLHPNPTQILWGKPFYKSPLIMRTLPAISTSLR